MQRSLGYETWTRDGSDGYMDQRWTGLHTDQRWIRLIQDLDYQFGTVLDQTHARGYISSHHLLGHCDSPVVDNPSCLQATWASGVPQKSSHTVPQALLLQISTRPWVAVPPWSLMAPRVHVVPVHLTPASSLCPQLWDPSALAGQSMSLVSVPRHWTLSNQIWPAPLVKPVVRAAAAVWKR
jgi:hypothetical protein